jgi:hypothetical protein
MNSWNSTGSPEIETKRGGSRQVSCLFQRQPKALNSTQRSLKRSTLKLTGLVAWLSERLNRDDQTGVLEEI